MFENKKSSWILVERYSQHPDQPFCRNPILISLLYSPVGSGFLMKKVFCSSNTFDFFEGVYFIDRNPKHFDRILDFLRTGKLSTSGLKPHHREKLMEDLDYYQITGA